MSDFSINKYKVIESMVILDKLFLDGDEIYIQSYDPKNGRPQIVFTDKGDSIGKISSKQYWEIENKLELQKK